jgi:ketosteroid isomerase-like protein
MFRFKHPGNIPLAAATALLVASCQSPGKLAAESDAEIRTIHQARLAAIVDKDFNTLEGFLADDFIVTFPNGTVGTKATYLGGQRAGRLLMTSATHDDERIKVYGDAAIITGRTTGKLLVEGKEQPLLIRYTHVYVKQGGQWRMVAQHTTPISR